MYRNHPGIIQHLLLVVLFGISINALAQEKVVNPIISYAGNPQTVVIGGITTSGVEGYDDYVLTGISGLTVGQEISLPGNEITEAVKRYWKHGLFSDVSIAADSIVGDKVYLHIYLKTRPRVSVINYIGHGLLLDENTNTLSVNTVDGLDNEDNTLPITAAAVSRTVGNINALLGTI